MRAWIFQDLAQLKKVGDKATWHVGFYTPDGKRRQKKAGCKSTAEKLARKIEGQLAAGLYRNDSAKTWPDFRAEYEAKILPQKKSSTRRLTRDVLNVFERVARPAKLAGITTQTIDAFVTQRRQAPGKKAGSKLSPATINRDLRHLKAVLRVANEWGYLPVVPKFRKQREAEEIGPVITPEHFEAIYRACDAATLPERVPCGAAEWWRALLVVAMTTGWRINDILSLRRDDVDLETGSIRTRAADNKGGRDAIDHLPAVAVEHLRAVVAFQRLVFNWPGHERTLWTHFHRIQKAAGVDLPCPDEGKHECTASCHFYGFHALRRGFATLNVDRMSGPALQRRMRHRTFTTTLGYIRLADKMKAATDATYVPEFLAQRRAK